MSNYLIAPVKMSRILITGINGFVGRHLSAHLSAQGAEVFGFDLARPAAKNVFLGDMLDRATCQRVLSEAVPDIIFHLAGLIKSPEIDSLYRANLSATVTLFEQIIESGRHPIFVMAGSSAVYGRRAGNKPITEQVKLHPLTHYAISKAAQEMAALRYFESYGLPVVILRMFNLLGPGQSPELACSAFARQIALAEVTRTNEIVTGNLDARRDFVDVRDAVRAFALAAEKGKPGQVYNVCFGQAVSIRKCLETMISMSSHTLMHRVNTERVQKNDVPVQVGSASKIQSVMGWQPQIPLEQSLADLLDDWRQRVKSGVNL
jgi:GDP-4-dehydro-6-deoxy-D-mannose reductase